MCKKKFNRIKRRVIASTEDSSGSKPKRTRDTERTEEIVEIPDRTQDDEDRVQNNLA